MRTVYKKLADLGSETEGFVLATIISTRGSAPAKAGSSALFNRNGLVCGTVGGGILEGRVTALAKEYSVTGKSGIHDFDFDNDISRKEEAICGGRATILIDGSPGIHRDIYSGLTGLLSLRRTAVIKTSVSKGEGGSISVIRELFAGDEKSRAAEAVGEGLLLIERIAPQKKLIIAGAGHIAKVLCHLGSILDFEVTVLDDRAEFANRENLPDADFISVGDIGAGIGRTSIDNDTFIVIVTRGHNDDASALRACIGSSAAYIGMIGSRTKIEKMRTEFVAQGWASAEKWSSLHTPVGLEIGSRTVEEIAVSIAAELVLVRSRLK